MSELKQCPLCDGEARIFRRSGVRGKVCPSKWYRERVECKVCGLTTREYKKPNAAAHRWNNRPQQKQNTHAAPDVPELVTVGHLWEYAEYYRDDRGYYGYVKIITEENPSTHVSPASKIRHHRELVARDQAAEIIAAKDKEIDRLRSLNHYAALEAQAIKRAVAAEAKNIELEAAWLNAEGKISDLEAKLAQYEAQKPFKYVVARNCKLEKSGRVFNFDYSRLQTKKSAQHCKDEWDKNIKPRHLGVEFTEIIPLYTSPAPAPAPAPDADLRAENQKLREALETEAILSDRLASALEYIDDYSLSYADLGTISAVAQPALEAHEVARAALNPSEPRT